MQIKMIETRKGTEDGFTVRQFYAGHKYDVRETLARSFFAAGFAIPLKKNILRKKRKRKVAHD